MGKVIPLKLSKPALIRTIRALAVDSRNVIFNSALEKGIAGKVSMSEAYACLEQGEIHHGPVIDGYENPMLVLERCVAGRFIYLTVVVEKTGKRIFITHISEE